MFDIKFASLAIVVDRVKHELIAWPLLLLDKVLFKFIFKLRRKLMQRCYKPALDTEILRVNKLGGKAGVLF